MYLRGLQGREYVNGYFWLYGSSRIGELNLLPPRLNDGSVCDDSAAEGFSDNDSRPFCFPVPIKTLSYDSCVTISIHHYCLDTCGHCNN